MEFDVFLSWLCNNGFDIAATILSVIFGLVIMIVQIKKYRINSRQAKEDNLKYRTANYRENVKSPSQEFDTEISQYRLNKSSGELEELPDKLDLKQHIQSAVDQALPNMLSHLEPPTTPLDEVVDLHNDLLDSLDYLREADEYRLSLTQKYNLDPRTSLDKVLKFLSDEELVQRGKISALQSNKKEDVLNETSQVDTSK